VRDSCKRSPFKENLDEYRLGNWGNRSYFLPTVPCADDNPVVLKRFKEMAETGNLEGVKLLLHSRISPNLIVDEAQRRMPLHIAAARSDVLMTQLLLRFGADTTWTDASSDPLDSSREGRNPGEIAEAKEFLPVVALCQSHATGLPLSLGPEEPGLRMANARLERPIRLDPRTDLPNFMGRTLGQA